jgi:flagellar protein FliT
MNGQEIISIYEAVADLTGQMLNAARAGEWKHLTALENDCARHAQSLEESERHALLSDELRARKVRIIQKILADDREIRDLAEPWMIQLQTVCGSTDTKPKHSNPAGWNVAITDRSAVPASGSPST